MKLCLSCKHCYLDGGSPGYSEYTPAESPDFRCRKGYWEVEQYAVSRARLQSVFLMAEDCKDYEDENSPGGGAGRGTG